MMFFYFLKVIFDINVLKRFKIHKFFFLIFKEHDLDRVSKYSLIILNGIGVPCGFNILDLA